MLPLCCVQAAAYGVPDLFRVRVCQAQHQRQTARALQVVGLVTFRQFCIKSIPRGIAPPMDSNY